MPGVKTGHLYTGPRPILKPTFSTKTFYKHNKVASLQQFYDNKLRWEYLNTYTDTSKVSNFTTYYHDGKDYAKKETTIYREGKMIQRIDEYTNGDGVSEITKYYYDQPGILNKIELYKKYSTHDSFRLYYYTDIKIYSIYQLNGNLVELINGVILSE